MLRDTELCLQPPAMSICVFVPEGGWHRCQPFHEAHHPFWGRFHMVHSSLSESREPQEKTERDPRSRLDEVETLGTVPTPCPRLIPPLVD